jgi:hypothetical protein
MWAGGQNSQNIFNVVCERSLDVVAVISFLLFFPLNLLLKGHS